TYRELIDSHPQALTRVRKFTRPDGTTMDEESTRRAVQVDGKWLIITIGRDVTARERAKHELNQRLDELARSNRDLEQFAYVTSHDLSEPLRMVASYTQLLARRYGTHFDDDGREFMGYVVSGAQRMKQLIDDLLLYSRAGRTATELREASLDKALDAALANLAHAIRDSAASINRPAVLPTLACDKTGMAQVFQNLVANAIKFRGEAPPVIRIEALREGQDWIVSVTDNGIGIEPQYFDRIFVIFQRLHARADFEGTGIGLAICKKVIERHGGAIWVESTPGQGTSFKFRLAATS
ncbi:MAG: ATP-binding protein, partial [Ramlibacter sp.]